MGVVLQSYDYDAFCANNSVMYVDPSGHKEFNDQDILSPTDYAAILALTEEYNYYKGLKTIFRAIYLLYAKIRCYNKNDSLSAMNEMRCVI